MTKTPTDDQPGFVAKELEHCHAGDHLIHTGQTCHLTIGQAILCDSCLRTTDAIRVTDNLVVVVDDGRLLVRRGDSAVEILPHEVRRLVDALVEGVVGLVEGQEQEGNVSQQHLRQPAWSVVLCPFPPIVI